MPRTHWRAHGGRLRSETRHEHSQRILLPEAGEEMDVSESTVCVDVPLARPAPTNQVCGSPISGSRAYAMNTDERECGKFAESRGRKRQGEDVEELEANGKEQRLDADVQVRAHKDYREKISQEMRQPQRQNRCRRRKSPRTVLHPARQKCSRRLKGHSGNAMESKISTITISWSFAHSRMS